jgi:hypothetical protein
MFSLGKTEGKSLLRRSRHISENNIKMDAKEKGYEG